MGAKKCKRVRKSLSGKGMRHLGMSCWPDDEEFQNGNFGYTPGSFRKSGKQRNCRIPNLEEGTENRK
jgi:hypothetical protein